VESCKFHGINERNKQNIKVTRKY